MISASMKGLGLCSGSPVRSGKKLSRRRELSSALAQTTFSFSATHWARQHPSQPQIAVCFRGPPVRSFFESDLTIAFRPRGSHGSKFAFVDHAPSSILHSFFFYAQRPAGLAFYTFQEVLILLDALPSMPYRCFPQDRARAHLSLPGIQVPSLSASFCGCWDSLLSLVVWGM